jgi:hypothetical protein
MAAYPLAFLISGLRSVCQYGELHDAQLLGFFVVRGNHVCPQRLHSNCLIVVVIGLVARIHSDAPRREG